MNFSELLHQWVGWALPVVLGAMMILSCLALIIAVGWAIYRLITRPSNRQLIAEWCARHQLRLLDSDRRYLRAGPFFLSPNGTAVYFVTARDGEGAEKHFWMRCGHSFLGALLNELRVRPAD